MTIKDIARLSGVSVSTVSRVLNDRPDVSAESRARVRAVIEAYNYVPNDTARDLVRINSDAIGLVVRGAQNPFYTDVILAAERALEAAGCTMVMRQIPSGGDELACGAAMVREKRLRGVIFLGGRSNYTAAEFARITVPCVLCTYTNTYGTLDPSVYSSVSVCDGEEAERAVGELIRCGHRRIAALIAREDDSTISQQRYEGYCRALRAHGIAPTEELVISTGDSFSIADAYRAMDGALRRGLDCTGLFAISDDMAIGAMRALREHGRRIPDDCSVIAIDGIEVSEYVDPPLAALCQPRRELGEKSVELLLGVLEERRGHEQVTLCASLRPGGSIRRI